jgi:mono/diheme cytochrome c family protein
MGLAPDLRLARERVRPDVIVRWIVDPKSVRPSAEMPALGLSEDEARDAAAYILRVPLAKPEPAPAFQRLPVLERRVTYEEVAARVFRTSCTHCHADPGPGGDPGPGSTGGFGFAPRGVQLLSYRGTQLGYRDGKGGRRSLFTPEPALDGLGGSRLVAALVARYSEVAGNPVAEVRGMPLGLPPLPAEDIQLVETWVAQGAKE